MYESFFGFQRPPFELVPDPDFLFLGESHDSALANLVVGIESGKGFVAISGPVGTGKTTVLRALLRRLGREEKICFLAQPELETGDLLRAILDGFGIAPEGDDVAHLRRALRETMLSSDIPGILIIDEAHLLSEDALEQIRLLSNLEEDDRKLLQIILSGQPELKAVLSSERLRPLAQRIEMFYEIRPLDRADTHAYLDRRIRIAGNPERLVLESRAKDLIHDCAGGIPRLVNVLADRALITAYVGETHRVTEDVVAAAYDDLGEISQAVMPGSPRVGRRAVRRPRVRAVAEPREPRAAPEPVREPAPPVRRVAAARPAPDVEEPSVGIPSPGVPTPVPAAPVAPPPAPPPAPAAAPTRLRHEDPPAPAPAPPPVRLVTDPPAPSAPEPPGARIVADWEERRPEPAPHPPLPARESRPARPRLDRDRWLAGAGIAAVVILAAVSLGNRHLATPVGPAGEAGAAPVSGSAPADSASAETTHPMTPAAAAPEPRPEERAGEAPAEAVPGERVATPPPAAGWAVQVASFRTTDRANRLADQLRRETGEAVSVSSVNGESGLWYRVLVGEYATRAEVAQRMEELRATYDFGFLRRVRLDTTGGQR